MLEILGKYLLAVAAIVSGVVLVIYGDPANAEKWGSLATAAISAAVLYQQRQQGQVLQAQNQAHDRLTDKVESVAHEVNNGAADALKAAKAEAYAAGIRDTTRELKPTIEAMATAVTGTGNGNGGGG